MFCYQENTHFSQALPCSKEVFWEMVRKPSTAWRVDARRAILAAVEASKKEGVAAIQTWLNNADYQKFLLKKQGMKKETAKKAWESKTDAERLLAFAQEIKDNLPAFIFACRAFDETETARGTMFRHRRLADCHLNGLVMLDIDHVDNPMQVFWKLREMQELMQRVKLVHITSSQQGIRIVFAADAKVGNLADNQTAFAQALGYKADDSCIDATRNSFAPKEEDILFIDETIFDYYDEEFDKQFTPLYREKKTQPLHHESASMGEKSPSLIDSSAPEQSSEIKWRGYDIQSIIDARYAEKLPCAADSNRHTESLKLATDLLIMLDGDKRLVQQVVESQPWVQEIIAERNENVAQTVASAVSCLAEKEKKTVSPLPSKAMQEAILKVTGGSCNHHSPLSTLDYQLENWGEQIDTLSADYPIIKDICKGMKKSQYPAALFVAGGLLMTLMTRCTYRFYHRPEELRRLNNSTIIIGDPASGKSFATRLFKLLAAPIVAADKEGKDAINAYREQIRTKASNKEKPKKPRVVVRIHPARTSNAQFIQDMVNAVEVVDGEEMQLHMLTFDTELDNTVSVQKGGSWIDKFSMELKAFHNEEDGQAYSNVDSILQDFIVTWNYIYTGTPLALSKKVNESNFGTGLATRLTCIPLPSTDFKMIDKVQVVDHESDDRLKSWAFRLDRMKGILSLEKIVDELYDWTERRMADAEENKSKAEEMLLKRCAYHGVNFSAPFIVMRHWNKMHQEGGFWCGEFETDESDWRLAELIVNIQYACQRHYFGAMAEKYFDNQLKDKMVNSRCLAKTVEAFNRLPEEFTTEDVVRCFGLSNNNAAKVRINRLMKDRVVEKIGVYSANGTTRARYHKTGIIIN